MYVKNENNQLVSAASYAEEILMEGFDFDQVTEEDAQNALAELYVIGYNEETASMFNHAHLDTQPKSIGAVNKTALWERLRKRICDFINGAGSTVWAEILEKILEFISEIVPWVGLIKRLVKAVVKYIINLGLGKLCPAV